MKKSIQHSYLCLILGKREIQEVIHLFQHSLQEVEITIDGRAIVDNTQLDTFDAAYQATSMLARGYEPLEVDTTRKHNQQLIELRMEKMSARLSIKPRSSRQLSGVAQQVEQLLLRCQNRIHRALVGSALTLSVLLPVAFWIPLRQLSVPFSLLLLIVAGGTLLLAPLFFYLFAFLVHMLKLDTSIFLFPATTSIPPQTGRREAIGMALVASGLVLTISIVSMLIVLVLQRHL
jgi:hypothetical protein